MLGLHQTQARQFTNTLESLLVKNPKVRFVLIGLSNGGAFVDKTVQLMSPGRNKHVIGVALGVPFWNARTISDNILHLDNDGNDPLTKGKVEELVGVTLCGFLQKVAALVDTPTFPLEEIWHIPHHDYHWEKIKPMVLDFIDHRLLGR